MCDIWKKGYNRKKKFASHTKSLSAQEKQKRNTAHMVVFHLNLQKCLQLGAKKK